MYDCKAPLSRFYYPDTRRIINAFIIIIIIKMAAELCKGVLLILQRKALESILKYLFPLWSSRELFT